MSQTITKHGVTLYGLEDINIKPWGTEEVLFHDPETEITIKLLIIRDRLSHQYHPEKDEWMYVLSDATIATSATPCVSTISGRFKTPGEIYDSFHAIPQRQLFFPRNTVHSLRWSKVLEVSWGKNETVRLRDYYGREATGGYDYIENHDCFNIPDHVKRQVNIHQGNELTFYPGEIVLATKDIDVHTGIEQITFVSPLTPMTTERPCKLVRMQPNYLENYFFVIKNQNWRNS